MSNCTILIPAYGNWDYLRRAIQSLSIQVNADSLVVIISDDKPDSSINQEQLSTFKNQLNITYIKQEKNLGVTGNKKYLFSLVKTRYASFLDHDDTVSCDTFYQDACNSMDKYNAYSFYSASIESDTGTIVGTWKNIDDTQIIGKLNGDYTLHMLMPKESVKMFVDSVRSISTSRITSWSSLVFDAEALKQKGGGFAGSYFPTEAEFTSLNAYHDEEWMAFLLILLCIENSLVTNKPTTIRQIAPNSASKMSSFKKDSELYIYAKACYFIFSYFDKKGGFPEIQPQLKRLLLTSRLTTNSDGALIFLKECLKGWFKIEPTELIKRISLFNDIIRDRKHLETTCVSINCNIYISLAEKAKHHK